MEILVHKCKKTLKFNTKSILCFTRKLIKEKALLLNNLLRTCTVHRRNHSKTYFRTGSQLGTSIPYVCIYLHTAYAWMTLCVQIVYMTYETPYQHSCWRKIRWTRTTNANCSFEVCHWLVPPGNDTSLSLHLPDPQLSTKCENIPCIHMSHVCT